MSSPKTKPTTITKGLRGNSGPNTQPGALAVTGVADAVATTSAPAAAATTKITTTTTNKRGSSPKGLRGNTGPNTQPGSVPVAGVSNDVSFSAPAAAAAAAATTTRVSTKGLRGNSGPNTQPGAVPVTVVSNALASMPTTKTTTTTTIIATSTTNKRGLSPTNKRGLSPTNKRASSPPNKRGLSPTNKKGSSPTDSRGVIPSNKRGLGGRKSANAPPGAIAIVGDSINSVAPRALAASSINEAKTIVAASRKGLGVDTCSNVPPGAAVAINGVNEESTIEEPDIVIPGAGEENCGLPDEPDQITEGEDCWDGHKEAHQDPSHQSAVVDYQIDRRPDHHANTFQPATAVVAELVDEDEALAAQNEIDRLKEELEMMRQHQQSQPATVVEAQLVLHGRDNETNVLRSCLNNTEQKQLVMISGYSGCGKTALACSLKPAIQKLQGLYISGKFDLYQRDRPYFGIISACEDICAAIVNLKSCGYHRKQSFQAIHDELSSSLSPQDVQIIIKVVPGIGEIMDVRSEDELPATEGGQDAKNRLHFVFRKFFRIICSFFAPLVIVLDDLQWSDAASLELMQVILTDTRNPNLLMIGLYRSNEVIRNEEDDAGLESHLLTTVLRDLKEREVDSGFKITELEVGNLDLDAVQLVLMDLLSIETVSTHVAELASICYQRTVGNVFFLISFVAMLEEEGLLKYDAQLCKYTWDLARINSQTKATSNVVDLMKCRMAKLPKDMGHVLSIAACLGATFDLSILDAVWHELPVETSFRDNTIVVEEQLSDAAREGFIEHFGNAKSFRWIHDKIQEAAFSLIPSDEVRDFKFRIGDILRQRIYLEEHIFQVVNLLNEPPTTPLVSAQRMELAKLNLQATKKALSCSAYSSAAKFASKGIDHLADDHWIADYKTSMELYTCAAESHEALGKYEEMKVFCDEVLKRDCPLLDKVPIYSVLASQLGSLGKHAEATELLLEVLGLLGCKYPTSNLGRLLALVGGVVKFNIGAKSRTLEEARRMPRMECPKLLAIMKLNNRLVRSAALTGSNLCVLALLRGVKLTLEHGVSPVSPPAFASAATIMTAGGDIQSGGKLGEYALELLTKCDSLHWASHTRHIASFMVFFWVRPLSEVSNMLLEAYSEGLHSGDTESATWAIESHIELSFFAGSPLHVIHADCSTHGKQMMELKREQALDCTKVSWQMVQNLMGPSENPTMLQGDIIPDYNEFIESHKDDNPAINHVHSWQLRLHAIFGSYEAGADLIQARGYEFPKVMVPGKMPTYPLFVESLWSGGVCCFAAARISTGQKRRKAKQLAMKARATIKDLVKQGNPNVLHCKSLMDAERDALRNRNIWAEKNYYHAIGTAMRLGFVHDAALAHERCSDFMMTCLSNRDGAAFHLKEARRLYAEWGATRKVEALQEEKSSLLCD